MSVAVRGGGRGRRCHDQSIALLIFQLIDFLDLGDFREGRVKLLIGIGEEFSRAEQRIESVPMIASRIARTYEWAR